MITALATVLRVDNTSNGNRIVLSCEQKTSCNHCPSRKNCGAGMVSKVLAAKSHHWHLITTQSVAVGQVVEIGLPEKSLIKFALIVYLIPLLMLMLGALTGQYVANSVTGWGEGATVLLALLYMVGGIGLAKWISARLQSKSEQSVTLIRVIADQAI